ncbi:hypothetical protein V1281_004557 [Nitrobacteraceae bacterium AZCC 2161]
MGTVIQLLERAPKHADISANTYQVDAVQISARATKDQIAAVTRACETLSGSIDTLQRNLKIADGLVGTIDDPETREKLQRQIQSIEAALMLGSTKLFDIKRTMQATSHSALPAGPSLSSIRVY